MDKLTIISRCGNENQGKESCKRKERLLTWVKAIEKKELLGYDRND